jgi:hypothetical protein
MRTAIPRPFLAYYPVIVKQEELNEEINFIEDQTLLNHSQQGIRQNIKSSNRVKATTTPCPAKKKPSSISQQDQSD